MILDIKDFDIRGVKLFNLKSYKDYRGSLSEVFLSNLDFPEFKIDYVQENESISNFGVFRGMHLQKGNHSQSKLIRVVRGKVIDVVCDLRRSSTTFKKILFIDINPNQLLFLPKGLAHGFLSLEEGTILNYKCDNLYNPDYETGFSLFNSNIDIEFPLTIDKISLSSKDELLPDLNNSYIYNNL